MWGEDFGENCSPNYKSVNPLMGGKVKQASRIFSKFSYVTNYIYMYIRNTYFIIEKFNEQVFCLHMWF